MHRDLYIKAYESDNTNNYILEIKTANKYDFKYWTSLRDKVFNGEVGECLFDSVLDILKYFTRNIRFQLIMKKRIK